MKLKELKKIIKKNKFKIIGYLSIILILTLIFNYNNCETYKNHYNIEDYMNNKRVILVGPAEHVNNGKFIDSHDVVVRINRGIILTKDPDKYGSKTDLMYMADGGSYYKLTNEENDKLKFIKFQFPDVKQEELYHPLSEKAYEEYKTIPFSEKILRTDRSYLDFEKKIKTRPNCGTFAIWDLLKYNIKSLYITGITLNTTRYNEKYNNNGIYNKNDPNSSYGKDTTHNLKNMAKYFKNNVITDNRVYYDKEFSEAVDYILN